VIYPVVRPSITLAYSMLWRPNGRGLHSTPLKWSNDRLEYHDVFLSFTLSRLRGISTKLKARAQSRTQATTWAHNTTQRVIYSNGAQVTITKNRMRENEVLVLKNDQWMLGWLLHAPRGPFYSPKVARSHWRHSWKAILVFCRVCGRTSQVIGPTCTCPCLKDLRRPCMCTR
jgi:hypothetical protein